MRTTQRRQRGITFVETAAYLSVVSVLLGSGLPALVDARDLRRLDSAVAELQGDIQHARNAAISLNQPVRLRTITTPGGSCTVLHVGPVGSCNCDLSAGTSCLGEGRAIKSSTYAANLGVRLSTNVSTMTFGGDFGTVTPAGSFVAGTARHGEVKLVVSLTGRSRTCRLSGTSAAHPAC